MNLIVQGNGVRPLNLILPRGPTPMKHRRVYRWAPPWLVGRLSDAGSANEMYSPE